MKSLHTDKNISPPVYVKILGTFYTSTGPKSAVTDKSTVSTHYATEQQANATS